jgi:hypothetical protein
MTTVYVSQVVGEELVQLAVALDGDGGISDAALIRDNGRSRELHPLSYELRDRLDWDQLATDAREALNARLRGWP